MYSKRDFDIDFSMVHLEFHILSPLNVFMICVLLRIFSLLIRLEWRRKGRQQASGTPHNNKGEATRGSQERLQQNTQTNKTHTRAADQRDGPSYEGCTGEHF